jgi:carbonic anhydrase
MKKLIQGLREFKESYYPTYQNLFEQLSHGQNPRVLFITCSDSRIDPNLITQAGPGDLFVIRNAGNIVPPHGSANGGEGAAIEYAVHALGINQIIVCGHSHCGAMKGLLKLNSLQEEMPLVYDWLKHAEATRRMVKENYGNYQGEELLEITIAENVLTQIENLKTYPVIRSRMFQGKLHIYGWIYHIENGEILAFDPATHSYLPPQSQLPNYRMIDGPPPGQFTKTSAPPVACEIPAPRLQGGEPAATSTTPAMRTPMPPVSGTAATRTTATPASDGGSRQDMYSPPWLSPEQAERIYRGSHS